MSQVEQDKITDSPSRPVHAKRPRTRRWLILVILGIVGLILGIGYLQDPFAPQRGKAAFPASTREVLENADSFIIIATDPEGSASNRSQSLPEMFHEFPVIGKAEVKDKKTQNEILQALYSGVGKANGETSKCFNPRHGIRATKDGQVVEVLICFECGPIWVFPATSTKVSTSKHPANTFNRIWKSAGLRVAG